MLWDEADVSLDSTKCALARCIGRALFQEGTSQDRLHTEVLESGEVALSSQMLEQRSHARRVEETDAENRDGPGHLRQQRLDTDVDLFGKGIVRALLHGV